jgi:hypothetical protein
MLAGSCWSIHIEMRAFHLGGRAEDGQEDGLKGPDGFLMVLRSLCSL